MKLESGVIAIVGPNGAGKSSIIDAISFALLGLPVSRNVKRKSDLIQRGSREAKVSVSLHDGKRKIIVERSLSSNAQGYAYLKICEEGNCRVIAKGSSKVTEEVVKLFGLERGSQNILKEMVFVPQGKLTELVDMTSSTRRDFVEKLLRLRELKIVKEKLGDVMTNKYYNLLNELKVRKRTLMEKVREIEQLKREFAELQAKLENLKRELEEEESKLSNMKEELRTLEALKERYSEISAKLREVTRRKDETLKRKGELEAELKRIVGNSSLAKIIRERETLKTELENLEEVVRHYEMAKKVMEIEDELKELMNVEEKFASIEAKIEKVEEQLRNYKEELERIIEDLSNLDPTLRELELIERAYSKVRAILKPYSSPTELSEALEGIRSEISELEEASKLLEKERTYIQLSLNELRDKIEKLRKSSVCPVCGRPLSDAERKRKVAEYEAQASELEKKLLEIENKMKEVRRKLETKRELFEKLERKYNSITAILESLSLKDLRDMQEKLGELYFIISSLLEKEINALEEARLHRNELALRRKRLEEKVKRLENDLKSLQLKRGELLEAITTKKHLIREKDKIERQLPLEPEEVISSYKRYLALKRKLEEIDHKVQKVNALLSKIETLKEQLDRLSEEEKELVEELESLNFNEKEYERTKNEYEKLLERISSLEKEISSIQTLIETYKPKIESLGQLKEELKSIDMEIMRIEGFIHFLKTVRKDLGDRIPSKLMEYLRENWSIEASEILKSFDTTISSVYIDENWNVVTYSSLGELDVGMLSGGERVSVALALKLALLRVFTNTPIQFMILDEPTVYLDTERKKALKEIIIDATRYSVEQLIIVTHDREIIDVANKAIEVIKKGSISEVKSLT